MKKERKKENHGETTKCGFAWNRALLETNNTYSLEMPSFQACCAHDHDCEEEECGGQWTLHKYINESRISCLNERNSGSCKNVFRPWDTRLDVISCPLESEEDDPELLVHVEFNGSVKLKALTVIGLGEDGSAPSAMRVFCNRDDLDFSSVQTMPPVQEWELVENQQGLVEYPVKTAKFQGVHSIDLHFPTTFGGDTCPMSISYIGFKGEFEERRREAVHAVYESRPIPKDHQVPGMEKNLHDIM